jgi:uncharacterized circularly permuted ATP-grasp superfamily protein
MERPWQLDPVPLIIAPEEWRKLETGSSSAPPC